MEAASQRGRCCILIFLLTKVGVVSFVLISWVFYWPTCLGVTNKCMAMLK